jgi:predicted permease
MLVVDVVRGLRGSLVQAWRSLVRRPGYFAIAVSSHAIALGFATTVIAHVDSLINPDFGTPYINRLYWVSISGPMRTPPNEDELIAAFNRLAGVERAGFVRHYFGTPAVSQMVRLGTQSGRVEVMEASRDFFDALGARPLRGRWPAAGETGVALITEETWRRRFRGIDSLDRIRLTIGGHQFRVVGVIRRNTPPFGIDPTATQPASTVVVPRNSLNEPNQGIFHASGFRGLFAIRAQRGADSMIIAKGAAGIMAQMQQSGGLAERPLRMNMLPFSGRGAIRIDGYQKAMIIAAGLIVLIACANVSALMLARAVARRRDQALRLALGAERRHIVADIAAEIAIVAGAGGLAAIIIGAWSMRILAAVTPPDIPWLGFVEPHWSPWVFVALFGVVLLAVVMATLIPAFFVSGISPAEQLKDNSGTTTGRPPKTFQVLVVGELALSLILMLGAVLVAKSADVVGRFDFGYEPRGLDLIYAGVRVSDDPRPAKKAWELQPFEYNDVRPEVIDLIAERLRREPGVTDASWVTGAGWGHYFVSDESSVIDKQLLNPHTKVVGPGFLRTLGIRLVDGRDFIESDRIGRGAVILDELSAQRLFAGGDAVGKLVKVGTASTQGEWIPVVGVVQPARHEFPADPGVPVEPSVYWSSSTADVRYPRFVVRGVRDAGDVAPRAAAIVRDLLGVDADVTTGSWLAGYDRELTTRRFTGGMFLTLSLASLALAAAGLFGVLSYAVNQRMREFAVRVALGAQRAHVVKLVFHDGFVMALGGTAIGAAIAMYAAMSLWEWLWGVYPVDAQALIISEGILLLVTGLGAILPAIRATRANPVDVLRAN